MKKTIVLFMLILSACSKDAPAVDPEVEQALVSLDNVLDNIDEYSARKEAAIDSLRLRIPFAGDGRQLYEVYDGLFGQFRMWNCDSALFYAHRKAFLAEKLGDESLINDAAEDIASRYITSAMYMNALNIVMNTEKRTGSFFREVPSRELLLYEIYHNLVLYFNDKYGQSEHLELEAIHLEKAVSSFDKDDINYYIYLAKTMIADGESGQLIIILKDRLTDSGLGVHDRAIINFWLGRAYDALGDGKNSLLRYIFSAREDIECANREYGSLIHVAQVCYNMGMTERAHRYINRCHEDALIADAKRRLSQIGDSLSEIETAYEQISRRQKSIIVFLNVSLLLIMLMLVAAIVQMIVNLNKLKRANKAISDNMQVIHEATRTNEVYLGQFFSMFSNHIDALERYRSRLRVLSKKKDMDAMQQELRSNKFINEELANLYDVFDKTFLGLFPNFIQQLNALLRPEERIPQNLPNGKLTNEIRVLALIKLGMTESRHIAKFLRLSPTTVFNYRVKYRNAALSDRESFEESLGSIRF